MAPRFHDSRHMKVVRSSDPCIGRLYLPGNISGTHFCSKLSTPQCHNAAGKIMTIKRGWGRGRVQYKATNMYLWRILSKLTICSFSMKRKRNMLSRNSEKFSNCRDRIILTNLVSHTKQLVLGAPPEKILWRR